MKVVLFMAASLNGFIADKKGREDFLSHKNWELFVQEAEKTGCFIVGRKTYKLFTSSKDYNFNKIKCRKIVVSKKENDKSPLYASSPRKAIEKAKKIRIKRVLLIGGSKLNYSFIKYNLIDEIIINLEPAIIGKGINLFSEGEFHKKLQLIKVKKIKELLQLNYKVLK